jgi:site-specific recombinase XerD
METIGLEGAVQLFDLYCRSKGLAERTLETYRDALRGLRGFLAGVGCGQQIPTAQSLRTYVAWMLEKGLSPTTVAIRMRSIRAFCNFVAREGIVEKSPIANVGIPKTPSEYPEVLSQARL